MEPHRQRLIAFLVGTIVAWSCVSAETQKAIDATLDFVEASDKVLRVAYQLQLDLCVSPSVPQAEQLQCIDKTREQWRTIILSSDLLHNTWCSISPESEGCKK